MSNETATPTLAIATRPVLTYAGILLSYLTPVQIAGAIERWELECEKNGWRCAPSEKTPLDV